MHGVFVMLYILDVVVRQAIQERQQKRFEGMDIEALWKSVVVQQPLLPWVASQIAVVFKTRDDFGGHEKV